MNLAHIISFDITESNKKEKRENSSDKEKKIFLRVTQSKIE